MEAGAAGVARYQPIVQLADGHVVAHEALAAGPAGCAQDAARGADALRRAVRSGWRGSTGGPLFLHVHAGALAGCGMVAEMERMVAGAGLAPADVVLQVGDAERLAGDARRLAGVAACRAAGFWIALGQVGAGACGLRPIVEVVPDVVKVDRALAGGMDGHRGRRAAVAALARLARELGIVLVAEGIDTESELRTARELGVPLGQGRLLGEPSIVPHPAGSVVAASVPRRGPEPVGAASIRRRRAPDRRAGVPG